jgi:hypothetical protein
MVGPGLTQGGCRDAGAYRRLAASLGGHNLTPPPLFFFFALNAYLGGRNLTPPPLLWCFCFCFFKIHTYT